jgi:hypothetical protein
VSKLLNYGENDRYVAKTNLIVVKDMVRRAYHGRPQEDNVTLIGSSPSSIISMSPCGNEYDGDDEGDTVTYVITRHLGCRLCRKMCGLCARQRRLGDQ